MRRLNHERTAGFQEPWRAVAELSVLQADALGARIYNLPGTWEVSVVGIGAMFEDELVRRRVEIESTTRAGGVLFVSNVPSEARCAREGK